MQSLLKQCITKLFSIVIFDVVFIVYCLSRLFIFYLLQFLISIHGIISKLLFFFFFSYFCFCFCLFLVVVPLLYMCLSHSENILRNFHNSQFSFTMSLHPKCALNKLICILSLKQQGVVLIVLRVFFFFFFAFFSSFLLT